MSQGTGGWLLDLHCVLCGATDRFRGVLLSLAAQRAQRAGWAVQDEPVVLMRGPGEREETCPKCSDALAG